MFEDNHPSPSLQTHTHILLFYIRWHNKHWLHTYCVIYFVLKIEWWVIILKIERWLIIMWRFGHVCMKTMEKPCFFPWFSWVMWQRVIPCSLLSSWSIDELHFLSSFHAKWIARFHAEVFHRNAHFLFLWRNSRSTSRPSCTVPLLLHLLRLFLLLLLFLLCTAFPSYILMVPDVHLDHHLIIIHPKTLLFHETFVRVFLQIIVSRFLCKIRTLPHFWIERIHLWFLNVILIHVCWCLVAKWWTFFNISLL